MRATSATSTATSWRCTATADPAHPAETRNGARGRRFRSSLSPLSGRSGDLVQLVLQLQALLLEFVQGLVAQRFDFLFVAADALVHGIVFFQQTGEVVVAG